MKQGTVESDSSLTLFKPSSWLAQIDFINQRILLNNEVVTILSEKNGGKSSFATLLKNALDPQIKTLFMSCSPSWDQEAFIQNSAAFLDLKDEELNLASLISHINECKKHVLILMDDAHHLPKSWIKEVLSAIESENTSGFFHLCFIADYSLLSELNLLTSQEAFKNLITTLEIDSLNESEMRTYVQQKAMAAQFINKPLTDTQFKQFYQQTQGHIAKINRNLESFVFKCSTHKKNTKCASFQKISVTLLIMLSLGSASLYYKTLDSHLYELQTQPIEPIQDQSHAALLIMPTTEDILVSHVTSWNNSSEDLSAENFLKNPNLVKATEKSREENIQSEQSNLASNDYYSRTQEVLESQLVAVILPKHKMVIKKQVLESQLVPIIMPKHKMVIKKQVLESQLVPVIMPKHNMVIKKQVLKSQLVSVIMPKHKGVIKNREPNLTLKPYTLQILASHKVKDINLFRKKNHLLHNTKIRRLSNDKELWYVLTMGDYDNRNKAQIQAKRLPLYLTKLKPWIRPVKGLIFVG